MITSHALEGCLLKRLKERSHGIWIILAAKIQRKLKVIVYQNRKHYRGDNKKP